MLLSSYEQASLLCNLSFNGKTSRANEFACRADLVLEEGEVADSLGRRKPPVSVVRQAILLASDNKISMLVGGLHSLSLLDKVMERYSKDLSDNVQLMFFIENIGKPMQLELDGKKMVLLPIADTAVWNEAVEELHLEKEDFKGQSPEDKLITLQGALADYRPKYPVVSYADAQAAIVEIKGERRGAV